MLLGAANYFLVRAIGTRSKDRDAIISLIRFAEVEIGVGLTVILAAASLTSQPPGVDLTQDRVTLHEVARRYSLRMPRLSSPDVRQLAESSKEIRRRAKAEGRKLPSAFVPGADRLSVNTPADIAWSEYNHNWAGIFVALTGLLALFSRCNYFPWAKMWPLIFLGLAVFLFLRSDPENWPLGPNGFWESFAVSDVLQHRIAVILVIMFAIFQWRVETNRVQSHFAALVFPAVCALGGVVLLTHTHALSNVKEELLVEMSHIPLAILAVIAGWSRWLELRLPEPIRTRKCLAWVWPVCFLMIGLILMGYHEADLA
jgi:copper resistance protein D